jgi:hypothetical protein
MAWQLRSTKASELQRPAFGPIEALRGALQATRTSGQPDWPTRVTAARALAALRPDEVKGDQEQTKLSITVFDLPPGTPSVTHHALEESEAIGAEKSDASEGGGAPEERDSRLAYLFHFYGPDGNLVSIGSWIPPAEGPLALRICGTHDPQEAELWRAELAAGRLPSEAKSSSEA